MIQQENYENIFQQSWKKYIWVTSNKQTNKQTDKQTNKQKENILFLFQLNVVIIVIIEEHGSAYFPCETMDICGSVTRRIVIIFQISHEGLKNSKLLFYKSYLRTS